MNLFQTLQPDEWQRPSGYSNGMLAEGRQIFIAGQIGWDARTGRFESDRLADQVGQALRNVAEVLATARATPEHVVRMTWFLTSRAEYLTELKAIGAAYRSVMGRHFPTMTVVEVSGLVEARAKVEIETTAVVP